MKFFFGICSRLSAGFLAFVLLVLLKAAFPDLLTGQVVKTPEKSIEERFPAAEIKKIPLYITKQDRARIEKELNIRLGGRFFTFHRAVNAGKIQGFVFFDTHTVRTKEETIAVFLDPSGRISSVDLISFFEPSEYAPSERWLKQFADPKKDASSVVLMTGATLTSHSVINHVKLAKHLFEIGRKKRQW